MLLRKFSHRFSAEVIGFFVLYAGWVFWIRAISRLSNFHPCWYNCISTREMFYIFKKHTWIKGLKNKPKSGVGREGIQWALGLAWGSCPESRNAKRYKIKWDWNLNKIGCWWCDFMPLGAGFCQAWTGKLGLGPPSSPALNWAVDIQSVF